MNNKIQGELDSTIFENQNFIQNVSIENKKEESTLYTSYQYEVRIPNQYKGEFMVEMRASDLRKVRKYCNEAKKSKFPINEILLAILGITVGVIITAFMDKIPFKELTFASIFSYNICPVITVAFSVLYYKNRKENIQNINELVEKIEEYIIDPDKDTDKGRSDDNEY
jgi:hypothetical protein